MVGTVYDGVGERVFVVERIGAPLAAGKTEIDPELLHAGKRVWLADSDLPKQ